MERDLFDGLAHFLAVARRGSFTAAAQELNISPAAASKAIQMLEARHQAKLFQRTTRSVQLTEAGQALFQRLDRAAVEIEDALRDFTASQSTPSGTLRLTVPHAVVGFAIEPVVARYVADYPNVAVDLSVNDAFVDLVAEGFDAGVRLGKAIDKDMIAVRLSPQARWVVAASPEYLAKAGRPKRVEDLQQHDAILFRFPGSRTIYTWEFRHNGKTVRVRMPPKIVVDNHSAAVRLAKRGLGLVFAFDYEIMEEVKRGELEVMFEGKIATDDRIFLYFPATMQSQPKLRAFIDTANRLAREGTGLKR
jgi:DNA-binding transcriptional LysR family regulator